MRLLIAGLLLVATACSSGSNDRVPCPGRPSFVPYIAVDISAVRPPASLKLCSNIARCATIDLSRRHHPKFLTVSFRAVGSERRAQVPLELTLSRGTQTHVSTVRVPVLQDVVQGCGTYGGVGSATADEGGQVEPHWADPGAL